jgi:RND family efflux transporter MFP subunit
MARIVGIALLIAAIAGGAWYIRSADSSTAAASRPGPEGGRGFGRGPQAMTVAVAPAARQEIIEYVTVVGNLIGEATVDVVPRVTGRIESVAVRLGDRVSRGQPIAKIEDREIREQINQVNASLQVNAANVANRESDLTVAETALQRAKTTYERGLASKQSLEDAEARHNAAVAQVNVARAQQVQTQARIDELGFTLSNTEVVSPVDGFVSRRHLDPGAFANANTVILSVVDIGTVRLVANLVERDFNRVFPGVEALVELDAFPGENFTGQVSRVAPVFDPATRTAEMEIEVPNPGFRLKPGMYARVRLTVERRPEALTVPRNAVVDQAGQRGVFLVVENMAQFQPVVTGIQDPEYVEVLEGLSDGQVVVTTGALALRDGDAITLVDDVPEGRAGRGRRGGPPEGR